MVKVKFIFNKKNSFDVQLDALVDRITIEDLMILNKNHEIYFPPTTLLLTTTSAISETNYIVEMDGEIVKNNILGIYGKYANETSWNKGEGLFLTCHNHGTYDIRGTTIHFQLLTQKMQLFEIEKEDLTIFLILSY